MLSLRKADPIQIQFLYRVRMYTSPNRQPIVSGERHNLTFSHLLFSYASYIKPTDLQSIVV